jgi:hypothetical protein
MVEISEKFQGNPNFLNYIKSNKEHLNTLHHQHLTNQLPVARTYLLGRLRLRRSWLEASPGK